MPEPDEIVTMSLELFVRGNTISQKFVFPGGKSQYYETDIRMDPPDW